MADHGRRTGALVPRREGSWAPGDWSKGPERVGWQGRRTCCARATIGPVKIRLDLHVCTSQTFRLTLQIIAYQHVTIFSTCGRRFKICERVALANTTSR